MKYNLDHLTQALDQDVLGPVQDDEALLLFALVRCVRMRNILELGGLEGYSAKNFLEALAFKSCGRVFTVDKDKTPIRGDGHVSIVKDIKDLTGKDIENVKLGLVFFDCHDESAEIQAFNRLVADGCIDDDTFLVLHDTNLHPKRTCVAKYQIADGWVHQDSERKLVNTFKKLGYDCLSIHTKMLDHDAGLPVRHGLTICKKFKFLEVRG